MICWQWKTFDDHNSPYLSGHSYSVRCKHIINYDGWKINPNAKHEQDNWIFVHTNHIHQFFSSLSESSNRIVLFTHNSDYPIDENYLNYLNDPRILVWFAINVKLDHPKLKSIPIGITPPNDNCGAAILSKIKLENNKKENMFYSNFCVENNKQERETCLIETKIPLSQKKSFEEYARDMSKSYFCISPEGNGIDCHRTWESLYVRTIPIVTKSNITDTHKDMPIIVLNDWSDFKNINFDECLYHKTWNNFDVSVLYTDNYMARLISQIPN